MGVAIRAVLERLPPLRQLASAETEPQLRSMLASMIRKKPGTAQSSGKNAVAEAAPYKLLQFVFGTNRLFLRQAMREEHKLPSRLLPAGAKQLAVVQSSPLAEKAFAERKQLHGSGFGFHGSPLNKWYSIMRNGLLVLSDTTLMTSGAFYGTGIYLARQLSTAAHYCEGAKGSSYPCEFGQALQILGVVEYINDPKCVRHHMGGIITVSDAKAVMLRYLLIYGRVGVCIGMDAQSSVDIDALDVDTHHRAVQAEATRCNVEAAINSRVCDLSFVTQGRNALVAGAAGYPS